MANNDKYVKHTKIILIPGIATKEPSVALKNFSSMFSKAHEDLHLYESEDSTENYRIYESKFDVTSMKHRVVITELYWNYFRTSISRSSLLDRFLGGATVIVFWMKGRYFVKALRNRHLATGLLLSIIVFFLWYISIMYLSLEYFVSTLSDMKISKFFFDTETVFNYWERFSNFLNEWQILAIIAFLGTGFASHSRSVSSMVDISDFIKRYIGRERVNGSVLKHDIVHAVKPELVREIDCLSEYDECVIVAYSFGSIIAVDLLAELNIKDEGKVRLVTMGSMLSFFDGERSFIGSEIRRLLSEVKFITRWDDVYLKGDGFSSGFGLSGVEKDSMYRFIEIDGKNTFSEKFTIKIHERYFDTQEVTKVIIPQ